MVFSRIDVKVVFLSNRFRKGLPVKLHNKKVFYILSLFRLINTFFFCSIYNTVIK